MIKPRSPTLQADSLPAWATREALLTLWVCNKKTNSSDNKWVALRRLSQLIMQLILTDEGRPRHPGSVHPAAGNPPTSPNPPTTCWSSATWGLHVLFIDFSDDPSTTSHQVLLMKNLVWPHLSAYIPKCFRISPGLHNQNQSGPLARFKSKARGKGHILQDKKSLGEPMYIKMMCIPQNYIN